LWQSAGTAYVAAHQAGLMIFRFESVKAPEGSTP